MKRKRNLILAVFVMVTFMVSALPVLGSADDYKVIKKAVKGKKSAGDVTWLRIEVTEKNAKKAKVKVKVPFSLVEMFGEYGKDLVGDLKDKGNIDFKKILAELKKGGPMTLIEVDSDDEFVKIWVE